MRERGTRKSAPLRKIVRLAEPGIPSLGTRDLVELACGHRVRSDATYQARCWRCQRAQEDRG